MPHAAFLRQPFVFLHCLRRRVAFHGHFANHAVKPRRLFADAVETGESTEPLRASWDRSERRLCHARVDLCRGATRPAPARADDNRGFP
jgi:hypothetical protein